MSHFIISKFAQTLTNGYITPYFWMNHHHNHHGIQLHFINEMKTIQSIICQQLQQSINNASSILKLKKKEL